MKRVYLFDRDFDIYYNATEWDAAELKEAFGELFKGESTDDIIRLISGSWPSRDVMSDDTRLISVGDVTGSRHFVVHGKFIDKDTFHLDYIRPVRLRLRSDGSGVDFADYGSN